MTRLRPATRHALSTSLVALALLVVGALGAAPSADAAGYTVWSCRGPQGEPLSTAAWTGGGDGTRTDDCATGGGLRVTLDASATAADAAGGFRFALPAGATIASWRAWLTASTAATEDGSSYAAGIADADGFALRGFTAGCLTAAAGCTWGDASDPLGAGNLAPGAGAPGLALAARCATATGCAPGASPAAQAVLYRSAVEIADDDAPVVGPLAGGLLAGAPVDRPQSVVVPAADAGGGVARVELLIDGAVAQVAPSGGACAEPFVVVAPCPAATDRAFTVDPATLPPGPHAVAARVADAAGNVTDGPAAPFVVGERPVLVAPGPPVVPAPPSGDPGSPALILTLPDRVAVPQRRATVGRARWSAGGAAARVRLDVLAGGIGRPANRMHRIGRVTTKADGTFVLPRSTSSRTLRVVPTSDALVARAAEVDAVAPLRVTLRAPRGAVRNGRTVSLRGTVDGAGDAAPDLPVLVQSIVGGRWSTVGSVRPGRTGNVVWRYRFQRTLRRSAYRFRFVVPSAEGRPWKATASPRRIVRVTP